MKPCRSCPFQPDALLGLWHPAHYLAIAYLGSANLPHVGTMGCHQWNGVVHPERLPTDSPVCGGWARAARDAVPVRLAALFGGADMSDAYDDEPVLSPEEMARLNGLDVERLPPLRWERPTKRHPDWQQWATEVGELRAAVLADPDLALDYVLPDSPLDLGVSHEEIVGVLGAEAAARYELHQEEGHEPTDDR